MIAYFRKCVLRVFLALGLLLQSCAPPGSEQPPPNWVTLKVLLLPYLCYGPLFIAEDEGYFAEQRLAIEFVKFDRSDEAMPALAQGHLDVFVGTPMAGLFNAIARGSKIKFVADGGHLTSTGCTTNAFMARRVLIESGELDHPAQLKGRRIALSPASALEYSLDKLLQTAGLTIEDVETVAIPSPARLDALEKGSIDLALAGEPWVTRILQAGQGTVWTPVQQVIPGFQISYIAYGPTLLEENLEAGRRFMVAYLKGLRQLNEGKTERNLEILAEHTGLDRDLLIQVCWWPFRDDGLINVQSMLDFQAWAVEKGYLDSPVTEEQFWDPSFVEYANEVLGAPSP